MILITGSLMVFTSVSSPATRATSDALNRIGRRSQVMGCGAQRGYKKRVRGTEVDVMMQPKIKFEIVEIGRAHV